MPLRTPPLEEPTINLISMLDVLLFLILFFMIGTNFAQQERQTEIQVPAASANSPLAGVPDAIVMNVAANGQVTIFGETRSLDAVVELLRTAREQYPSQKVLIRGDARCQYQQVMDALSVCNEAEIRNVSVAHVPRKRR